MDAQLAGQRQSQVGEGFERLHKQVELCIDAVQQLEARCQGALRQEPPKEVQAKQPPEPVLVPVAKALKEETDRVKCIVNKVRTITDRLEL